MGLLRPLWEDRKNLLLQLGRALEVTATSLFDSSAINSNCTAATNSVFLKNVQTNDNGSDGQRYYLSSQLGSPSASPDAQVFEPFQYNGKTYAWLYIRASLLLWQGSR